MASPSPYHPEYLGEEELEVSRLHPGSHAYAKLERSARPGASTQASPQLTARPEADR